ncbi:MAG: acyl-CoA/acyl-ACP dehydrogenase [Actinobacteria bacterium]|nr:acyl-CoA/acyl-ACP dehydrogenase [Actinomycetota bacterium]
MDFGFSEEQQAVRDLATQILETQVTHERLRALETAGEYIDRDAWSAFADANLLGIALPESVGGSGLGFIEICLLLEQVGRTSAPIPLLATLVGAAALAEVGHTDLLADVATGDRILTSALVESGAEPDDPSTKASQSGGGWVIDGTKICVPAGLDASHALVSARTGDGAALFLVDLGVSGVERTRLNTTSGLPEARLDFAGAAAARLGGTDALEWLLERMTVALCAVMLGCCEQALAMTASYAGTREQFDKPIGTFQAVGQRAADAYIDTEAIRLTMWQAAWRLSDGLPCAMQVATAKFWAADGGQRVVHAAQHIHGGIGVDRDYPLHRYFLWAKQLELTLGGATKQLRKIGAILAVEPV